MKQIQTMSIDYWIESSLIRPYIIKLKLEKTEAEGAIRDTGKISHTIHMTKTRQKQKHNTENSKDEQHGSHQKTGGEPRFSRRVRRSCFS